MINQLAAKSSTAVADWRELTLGDVCAISSKLVDPKLDKFIDLPHIGAGNIVPRTGELRDVRTARDEILISGKFVFEPTMVLYSKIRPYLMKACRPDFVGLCSADVYPLTPNAKELDRDFLFYLLLSEEFTAYAEAGSARSGMPKVNRDHLFAYRFRLPPLNEQRQVATVLDESFAAIATATANAEKNVANARELFESALTDVFGNHRSDWIVEPLKTHVRFIDYRGKTPPKRGAGVRLITAKNVRMGFIQHQPEEFVDSNAYDGWMTRGLPHKGDVLFTTEAPLGNVAQLNTDEKVVVGQRLITMQPVEGRLDSTFLKYMLRSSPLQRAILEQATGATVSGIKAKLLKEIPISYPSQMSEQRETVARLDALHDLTTSLADAAKLKIESLAILKQSLLHRAFSGELTARESLAA